MSFASNTIDGFDEFGIGLLALEDRFQTGPGAVAQAMTSSTVFAVLDAVEMRRKPVIGTLSRPQQLDFALQFRIRAAEIHCLQTDPSHLVGLLQSLDDPHAVLAGTSPSAFLTRGSQRFGEHCLHDVKFEVFRNRDVEVVYGALTLYAAAFLAIVALPALHAPRPVATRPRFALSCANQVVAGPF